MSDVIARIRVKEEHGIRRFLYPLSAEVPSMPAGDLSEIAMTTDDGEPVPFESELGDTLKVRFAVFLDPLAEKDYLLSRTGPHVAIPDPLVISRNAQELTTTQQHLRTVLGAEGMLRQVVYDGIAHLRYPTSIRLNEEQLTVTSQMFSPDWQTLQAESVVRGTYSDGRNASITAEAAACKSWVTLRHRHEEPKPGEEIAFTLPFAVTSDVVTCDFGIGGGIYGVLRREAAEEIVWRTEFGPELHAKWSVAVSERVDYMDETATAAEIRSQRWFHLIDSDKALAAAITEMPQACREMTVRLSIQGDVVVSFRLGEPASDAVTCGVCYHFLNAVPAIAAATNPPSILLPPHVEVLPL